MRDAVTGMARFGAGVALTVIVTLGIAAVAYAGTSGAWHRTAARVTAPSPTPPPASPTPLFVPAAGGIVRDAYALDASTGWVLLTDCNQPISGQCGYSISSTADGGRTWSDAVQVGPLFDKADGDAPNSVRFVNRADGFVSGSAEAYVTHDAGKTWHSSGLPAAVFGGFAVHGGTAWAVTNPCGKGIQCQWEVRSSPDGGVTWSSGHALPQGFGPFEEVAFPSGLLVSSVPFGDMEITNDGGATWRSLKTRCAGSPFRGYVATADGNELWEACIGYPDQTGDSAAKTLFVSANGGRSWSARTGQALPAPGITVVLVSNRPHVALAGTDRTPLSITRDSGATWRQVGPGLVFTVVAFRTAASGWALDAGLNVWTSGDSGAHWTRMEGYRPPS